MSIEQGGKEKEGNWMRRETQTNERTTPIVMPWPNLFPPIVRKLLCVIGDGHARDPGLRPLGTARRSREDIPSEGALEAHGDTDTGIAPAMGLGVVGCFRTIAHY